MEQGVDMLRPYRIQIGVRAGDHPINDLVNLNREADDDEHHAE